MGIGLTSMAIAGCGGGTKAADTTTIINQTVVQSSAPATASASTAATTAAPSGSPQAQAAPNLPQPPAGATQLKTDTENGVARIKYSINDQLPSQVTEYYANLLTSEGYTIISSTSGPDSGRQGGATAVASKNGTFVGVEADADPGEPTHFDVCQGPSESAVRDCID